MNSELQTLQTQLYILRGAMQDLPQETQDAIAATKAGIEALLSGVAEEVGVLALSLVGSELALRVSK